MEDDERDIHWALVSIHFYESSAREECKKYDQRHFVGASYWEEIEIKE
jgi:hypothetical protein